MPEISIKVMSILLTLIWIVSILALYDEMAIPLYLLFYIVVAFFGFLYLLNGISHLIKRRMGAHVQICFSIGIFLTIGVPSGWDSYMYRIAQLIKLEIRMKKYASEIQRTIPDENGNRFYSAPWGGFMLNGIDLIYDESDEIQKKNEFRSTQWRSQLTRNQYAECRIQPLRAHFYLASC